MYEHLPLAGNTRRGFDRIAISLEAMGLRRGGRHEVERCRLLSPLLVGKIPLLFATTLELAFDSARNCVAGRNFQLRKLARLIDRILFENQPPPAPRPNFINSRLSARMCKSLQLNPAVRACNNNAT